jgi:hypothetical protein
MTTPVSVNPYTPAVFLREQCPACEDGAALNRKSVKITAKKLA